MPDEQAVRAPRPAETGGSLSDPAHWVDRHGDALYAFAVLQLGQREAAEELVQETLVSALEARTSFRGEASERSWLIGILRHKICDHFRRRRRHEASGAEVDLDTEPVAAFNQSGKWKRGPRPWPGDPGAAADAAEFRETLRDCLSALPPLMREAYCLRELNGLETAGICKVLEITPTYLWTLLHRSRAALRVCLERKWFGR